MSEMQLPEELRIPIDQYWSQLIGCSPADLRTPELKVIFTDASPGVVALKTTGDWIIAFNKEISREATDALLPLLKEDLSTEEARHRVHDALSPFGLSPVFGPSELLYSDATHRKLFPPYENYRWLTAEDQPAFEKFRSKMDSYVEYTVTDPGVWQYVLAGIADDEIISVVAGRVWGNQIVEIYADTLAGHRNFGVVTGLGRVFLDHLSATTNYIFQTDNELTNPASGMVSRKSGFMFYGQMLMTMTTVTEA